MDLAKIRKKAKKSGTKVAKTGGREAPPAATKKTPAEPKEREPMPPVPEKAEEQDFESLEQADILPEELAAIAGSSSPVAEAAAVESAETTLAAADEQAEKLLIFRLDRQKYAIPIHDVAQIIEERAATPVPSAPPFLKGIISLRGRIVTVVDVAGRLGLKEARAKEGRKLIILDVGTDHYGLLVDAIERLVLVNIKVLEPAPEGFKPVAQDFVEGLFHHDGKAVAFLNLPLFLAFST